MPSVTSANRNHTRLAMQHTTPATCQHRGKHACLFLVLRQTSVCLPNFPSELSLHWYDGGKQRKEEIRGIGLFLHHHLRFSIQVKTMRLGPSEACGISCLLQGLFSLPAQVHLCGEDCAERLQARYFPPLSFWLPVCLPTLSPPQMSLGPFLIRDLHALLVWY